MQHILFLRRNYLSSLFLGIAFTGFSVVTAPAQSALDGFDPNADWFVRVVAVQPDGKTIVGGEFTTIGGISRNRIARLNPDGTLDALFDPDVGGTVNCSVYVIVVQPDGKILIGGDFSTVGVVFTRNNIARLNADGSLDTAFNPNANGFVGAITVQLDGKILAGGGFTSIGGQTRNAIARLDATSGAPDSLNPNASGGFPPTTVNIILVQPDGKILVGGSFLSIGGQSRNRIARLDPVTGLADSFNPSPDGFTGVQEIILQPDGKILVGGGFGNIGGQARSCVARLDPVTGAADSWNPNANNTVYAMALQQDGKVLIGGDFSEVGGVTTFMARLHPVTGAPEAAFNPGFNERVLSIAVQPDGKSVAGGLFVSAGGQTRNRIARLEKDGRLDRTIPGLSNVVSAAAVEPDGKLLIGNTVFTTAVQPDGKILIGGRFTGVLGVTRRNIARFNSDGTLDMTFDPDANFEVFSITVQADGKILAGGDFTSIGGQTRNRIARLDASTGAADSFNPNANSSVRSIAVQANGRILVGGLFTSIGGQTRNRMARFDPTSGAVDSFDPNADNFVGAIAVQADGKILAGGIFTNIGGQTRNRIARLDPISGAADPFDPNSDNSVGEIAVQADGKILASGFFTSIGGQGRNHIARLDAVTGLADSFNPNANNGISSMALQADGKVLAGGDFTSIGGQARNRIARLNTDGTADSFNPNADGDVYTVAVQSDGKILAGGNFVNIGGQGNNHFARLTNGTAAQQNLAVTQSTITWTRGGSSPHLARVTFESSTDNVNYTPLGNGTSTGSNWTLTGLSLTTGQNIYIRARGYYRGGVSNGSESITESVRNVFLSAGAGVSGTVTYGNPASATTKFISNATVTGSGSPNVFTTTAAPGGTAGQYALTGFGAGSYTVSLSKTTGQNGITAGDASRTAQHAAGLSIIPSAGQRIAADATGNGSITAGDASQIARFAAGLGVGTAITNQWRFYVPNPTFPVGSSPTTRSYADPIGNPTGQDYIGILVGEVTGNWTAGPLRPEGRSEKVEGSSQKFEGRSLSAAKGITVDLPSVVGSVDKEIAVPVAVQGGAVNSVIAYEFDLRYDPSVIQPSPEPVDVAGTVSRGLFVVTNGNEPGLLRVVVYGVMPIEEDGVLLNLKFVFVGAAGSVSPLAFGRMMFNEGEADVTVADGKVSIYQTN